MTEHFLDSRFARRLWSSRGALIRMAGVWPDCHAAGNWTAKSVTAGATTLTTSFDYTGNLLNLARAR